MIEIKKDLDYTKEKANDPSLENYCIINGKLLMLETTIAEYLEKI